jgi:hypothetical protein
MGLSVSFGAVGLGVAVANVKPTVETTVGVVGNGVTTLDNFSRITIGNDTTSKAKANMLSATAGAVGISANVLLVFNDTNATAKAANLAGSTSNLTINGLLGAEGVSDAVTMTGGAGAVGVNVSYVDVNSRNRAILDTDDLTATFGKWWILLIYIIWFVAIFLHLSHGFWSMFQSVGWSNQTWMKRLKVIGICVAALICLMFVAAAVNAFLQANGLIG